MFDLSMALLLCSDDPLGQLLRASVAAGGSVARAATKIATR